MEGVAELLEVAGERGGMTGEVVSEVVGGGGVFVDDAVGCYCCEGGGEGGEDG